MSLSLLGGGEGLRGPCFVCCCSLRDSVISPCGELFPGWVLTTQHRRAENVSCNRFLLLSLTVLGYKCSRQLSWPTDSSPGTLPRVWRRWVHPVQLRRLRLFRPVCSRSFKKPYLAPGSLFSTRAWGFCFHDSP